MNMTAILAASLISLSTTAVAAEIASDEQPGGKGQAARGVVEGTVTKVQPDAVIIQQQPEGNEVRLQLHESTHKGPVREGDVVVAFVTPGGTTTSVQPKDSRFYQ